jgi:hypothetical protein
MARRLCAGQRDAPRAPAGRGQRAALRRRDRGIVPQSAIVTGLGEAVLEKNRDARLLSPGALLDASLGERLTSARTSTATGEVREQDAIVRATGDGVVIQTADGIEALRCTGLPETLIASECRRACRPSRRCRCGAQPATGRARRHAVLHHQQFRLAGELCRRIVAGWRPDRSLFAWLTLANGDETGLADAATQAVAGKLNRDRVWVPQGEAKPIELNCWPAGHDQRHSRTVKLAGDDAVPRTSSSPAAESARRRRHRLRPPPSAAANGAAGGGGAWRRAAVSHSRISVTVAARSQKQVACFEALGQGRTGCACARRRIEDEGPLERVLVTRNDAAEGLGLPLPAGKVALFGREGGRRMLIGEGRSTTMRWSTGRGRVLLVERDEGEQAFGDLDLGRAAVAVAMTSIRIAIDVRPTRSTSARPRSGRAGGSAR